MHLLVHCLRRLLKGGEIGYPIGGYISGSRTSLVINTLRAKLCNRPVMDCSKCSTDAPCRRIDGLRDTILFKDILKDGERSTVFYGGINTLDRGIGQSIGLVFSI